MTDYTAPFIYRAASLETAACLWEAVLDMENDGITRGADEPAFSRAEMIRATREAIGSSALRLIVIGWTDAVDAAWKLADVDPVSGFGGQYGEPFDWEFVPGWIAANVDWSDPQSPYARPASPVAPMPTPRLFEREFPDFPAADVPAVLQGEGWTDNSWHNDACPFFMHEASGVGVWCGYAGPEFRENIGERFTAQAMEWHAESNGWQHDLTGGGVLFATDDADTLAASLPNFTNMRAIAHAFALHIETDCADDLAAIRDRNANDPSYAGCCASHDFCDANMPMAEAFAAVMGRPFVTDTGIADADLTLVNAAWDIARAERLTATKED
jgi:hypothetical protein